MSLFSFFFFAVSCIMCICIIINSNNDYNNNLHVLKYSDWNGIKIFDWNYCCCHEFPFHGFIFSMDTRLMNDKFRSNAIPW